MSPLGPTEYATMMSALRGDKFDPVVFKRAASKIRHGSAIQPEGRFLDRAIPLSLNEWRRDQQWSIEFINRHQNGCDVAWRAYWQVMTYPIKTASLELNILVADLPLNRRTLLCLQAENINDLATLLSWTEARLLKIPNLGRKSLNEIINYLITSGLSLSK
jgi:hypothetical protein